MGKVHVSDAFSVLRNTRKTELPSAAATRVFPASLGARTAPFALLWMAAGILAVAPAEAQTQVVTDTRRVSIGSQQSELLRKINGRWWTQDNRLVYPPVNSKSWLQAWEVSSKPGVVEFYHHRPFEVRRAEQLRLFMTPDEVEARFGQPNRRFPMRSARGGRWYYHGAGGIILDLWFMGQDELGQAKYLIPGGEEQPVNSIERELNGRSIFTLLAARARERAAPEGGSRRRSAQSNRSASNSLAAEVEIRHASEPGDTVQKRILAKGALDSIQVGATRGDLLSKLGDPTFKSAITSDEGVKETFTYHLDENTPVSIKLLNGRVFQIP